MSTRNEMHLKVIEKFGTLHQIDKAIEEMNELIVELECVKVNMHYGLAKNEESLKSELADVLNMCEQLKFIVVDERFFTIAELEQEQDSKMFKIVSAIDKGCYD